MFGRQKFSYLKGTTCVTRYAHASSHPIQTNDDSRRNGRHACSLAPRFHLKDANVGKRVHLAGTGQHQTRLRRAAIGGEFIFNLIKFNYFKLLYNTCVCLVLSVLSVLSVCVAVCCAKCVLSVCLVCA
jgi:hypothetical protein